MANLKPHPLSQLLPPMTADEYKALKSDIAARGQLDDIVLFGGRLLDGVHRYEAMRDLKIQPRTIDFEGTESQAAAFVLSRSIRRNLSAQQRAVLAVKFLPHFEAEAKARQGSLKKGEAPGLNGKSCDFAGKAVGVSRAYVETAKSINERDPELLDEVYRGELTLSEAKNKSAVTARRRAMAKVKPLAADDESCRLLYGDCLARLEEIPCGSVRVVWVDPQYNIGKKYDSDPAGDAMSDEDYLNLCGRWIAECARVLASDGTMFLMINAKYQARMELRLRESGLHWQTPWYWFENNPEHQQGAPSDAVRIIHCFTKSADKFIFNGDDVRVRSRRNEIADKRGIDVGKVPDNVFLEARIPGNSLDRVPFKEPPQIPIWIPLTHILIASNPGDTVLDCFNGNGTTGIVALSCGRKYIGIDRSKKYLEQSRQWIASQLERMKKIERCNDPAD